MVEHIRLGAFVLESPISSGGMGTVWRARHELTDAPVAVKVIAGANAQDPLYLDGFEREVRAVARMQHPRIIRVYDFGLVDSAAERSSDGELPRRSPWLAMELAERGSLAQLPGVGDWETLKAVLFDILDALAHSHARGIVHRDLKPGNVLLTESAHGVHCKLTDFGISHASGRSISTREVFASSAGTPWYMAPEQVESRWRDYGPWTDLYALGCVAYQLASGQTPFTGESVVRVARQQLFDRPPPLVPGLAAPAGFVAWVDRLLVKEIPFRFRRAADAAWALHQISPRSNDAIRLDLRTGVDATASGTDTTQMGTPSPESSVATLTFLTDIPITPVPKFSVPNSLLTFSVPPVPEQWGMPDDVDEAWLPGSGLGLYQVREIPYVGRDKERGIIWGKLREAVLNRVTRVVVVRGGPGSGKSRLAQWISQRAHELGAASPMHARHSPVGGDAHGIGPMFSRYLGCGGLDFERSFLRVRRLITGLTTEPPEKVNYYSAALAKFLHPTASAPGVPAVRFTSADERYQVIRQLAANVADRRALVCVLDDVQWGYDALEFARRLLDLERPALLILTVRPDQLPARPLEADALRAFEAHPAVTTLELGPPARHEYGTLLDSLLKLEPTLREEVLDRTGSSPLFAIELLGDWVRRRVLRATPHGFRLDATEVLPADIYGLWNRHVDRVLSLMKDAAAARAAIEVGAALGTSVAETEWREACDRLGILIEDDLVDQLLANGVVELTPTGWAFQHQMLRESIAEAARAGGRDSRQHRVIADMLRFEESPDNQLRRGLHYLAVEDWLAAAEPLLLTIEEMIASGRTREASAVAATLEQVFAHVPEEHQVRRRAAEARLLILRRTGESDGALAFIEETRPAAQAGGWQSTLASLARVEGAICIERGELARGQELLRTALIHARLSREPATLGAVHRMLGWSALRIGKLDDARGHFETARDHYQIASQPQHVSEAMIGIAEVARIGGDLAAAREFNDEAVRLCRQGGYRVMLGEHLNHRGDIAAAEGDHKGALGFYNEAAEVAKLADHARLLPIAILNVGVSLVYLERIVEARQHLREAQEALTAQGLIFYAYYAELGLLLCCAPTDPAGWDASFGGLSARAGEDTALRDSVEHAIAAAARWRSVGDDARAEQAISLARALVPAGYAAEYEPRLQVQTPEGTP